MKILMKLFLILTATLTTSCISMKKQRPPPKEAIFNASLTKVWQATERALVNYPIAESNIDSGILRTDYLRGNECFHPPGQESSFSPGVRCNLIFYFVKIPNNGIRVRINKTMEIIRDFISDPEDMPSDGLEELTLLYRIERELKIGIAEDTSEASSD